MFFKKLKIFLVVNIADRILSGLTDLN